MGETIERVARAIFAGADKPPSWLMGRNPDDWDALSPSERAQFEKCARAAIEAMLEPSRAMIDAAQLAADEAFTARRGFGLRDAHISMIAAALKEADRSGLGDSRDHDHTAGAKLEGEQ